MDAIRELPRPDRLRLAEQLNRDLAVAANNPQEELGPHVERRGHLLVYTAPAPPPPDPELSRDARIDALLSQLLTGRT